MSNPLDVYWFVQFDTGEILAADGRSYTYYIEDGKRFERQEDALSELSTPEVIRLSSGHAVGPSVGRVESK